VNKQYAGRKLGWKHSIKKDIRLLDLLFNSFCYSFTRCFVLLSVFPLSIDCCPLFGHFGFLPFLINLPLHSLSFYDYTN